jgi:hypothetical protein
MNLASTIRMMAEKKSSPPWDAGKQDYASAAKELKTYAMKDGGIDKKDMLSVANQLSSLAKQKSASVLAKMMRNIQGLDTDVREKIQSILKKHGLTESVMEAWLAEAPEDDEPASPDEGSMAMQQLEFIEYAADKLSDHIEKGGDFPEWMQNKLSTVNDNMQSLYSQIDQDGSDQMDEAVNMDKVRNTYSNIMKGNRRGQPDDDEVGDYIPKGMTKADIAALIKMLAKQGYDAKFLTKDLAPLAEARDPSKSGGSGYDLYHKDFSTAMKHAYDYAKKKFGITIDPKEIDDKVASGPRKPSSGKTNTYRLKGDKGSVQIQVANLDNKKYELNMYKEEVEIHEAVLSGRDYKVKDGRVHISKANFSKVHKDYKNATKGKERMTVLDPKSQATVSMPVKFTESVELDEAYKTPAEASAYEAGKKAVAKGVSYDDNPNKKGTKEYTAWSKGHNDARARKIARNEEVEMTEEVYLKEEDAETHGDERDYHHEKSQEFDLKAKEAKSRGDNNGYNAAVKMARYHKDAGDHHGRVVKHFQSGKLAHAQNSSADAYKHSDDVERKHAQLKKHLPEDVELMEEVNFDELFESAFEELKEATYQVDIKGAGRETVMAKNEKDAIAKASKKMKVHSFKSSDVDVKLVEEVEEKLSLEDTLKAIWEGKSIAKEDNTNDKSDDGEGLDKVQPKALKKKFKDRKDKDIDNDGDVDDSDEYLHNRRKTVSKAVKDEDADEAEAEKEVSDKEDEKKKVIGKSGKQTKVEVDPKLDEEKGEEMTSAEMEKKDEIMKSLEKKKEEFVKKYGDRATEVMARTAIKMAKKHA